MRIIDKVWVWALLVLSAMFIWLTPIVAAWFFLVDPAVQSTSGNALFYFVSAIIAVFAIKSFSIMLHKQKPNLFKHYFLAILGLAKFFIAIFVLRLTTVHMGKIEYFLLIWALGYLIGKIIQIIIVKVHKEYLIEIEVL